MSVAAKSSSRMIDEVSYQSNARTKFWGVKCETGLRYNQVVEKKYCITQAVLDPNSGSGVEDYVLVKFTIGDDEHIMAVLRHGEIYQVNLNILFDRECVSFTLKGRGTVHLLGYEILDSGSEDDDETDSLTPAEEEAVLPSNFEGKSPRDKTGKLQSNAATAKSGKERKNPKQSNSNEGGASFQILSKGLIRAIKEVDYDSEDNEEDDDFSIADEEEEEDDEEESEADSVNEDIGESEIEELEEDLEDMKEVYEPPSQKKRKKTEVLRAQKRQKSDSSKNSSQTNKFANAIIDEDDDSESEEESSESGSDTSADKPSVSKKAAPAPEIKSAEKKKNKKKKSKKLVNGSPKLDKSQQTSTPASKKFDNGLEIDDIKVGHGPAAVKGKMLHVYYIGRLSDKTIFDSRPHGSKPFSFMFGAGKVIKGWEIGLEGMRAGGKRKIKVPSSMGYGKAEIAGIPANSTLYFVVELIAVG